MGIAERLKEERKRLKLSQPDFGALGGAGKTTVIAWERGAATPNAAFLENAAAAGADVRYIVTGDREGRPAEVLSADERVMLDGYRALDPTTRKRVLAFILGGESPGGGKVVVHGRVGQQVEKIEGGVKIDMRGKK